MSDAPVAFFSYSREDSEFALRLAADLRAAGANVWIDQLDIGVGQRWDRSVQQALENCPTILIILSPASVKSDNVLDEVSFALDKQKSLIPILHRDCEIPFRVRRFQHLDFRTDYDRMLKELQKCLHVGGVPQTESVPITKEAPPAPIPTPKPSVVERFTPPMERTPAPSSISPPRPQPAGTAPRKGSKWSMPFWVTWPVILLVIGFGIYMLVGWGRHSPSDDARNAAFQAGSSSIRTGEAVRAAAGGADLVGTALAHSPTKPPCTLPQASDKEFVATDPGAWFFFAYRNGDASDQWTVNWVEPNGYVHKTDTVAHVLPDARYCFEMKIAGTPAQNAPGEWTVRLNRNGTEVADRKFTISK